MVLGEYPKGILFLFIYKKEKREFDHWDSQGQAGSSDSTLRPYRLCCLVLPISLSHGCYCLIKHTEIWP